ncbi:hypothetical protein [Arthrobacter sp. yr096]|uniref:hypothetical protein n=1 Tax=Arthrobacter sp. yr096 TaxID=1761750 RepID=UPI00115FC005|nr:hypothetical protein [Arthrobacter sp. yr096]
MTAKRRPGGHPAKQDPDVAKAFRTMKANVELVRDLEDKLTPEAHLHLKAAALGLMSVYAELTGMPSPVEIIEGGPHEPPEKPETPSRSADTPHAMASGSAGTHVGRPHSQLAPPSRTVHHHAVPGPTPAKERQPTHSQRR